MSIPNEVLIKCWCCKEEKPAIAFTPGKLAWKQYECRDCVKKKNSLYSSTNREAINAAERMRKANKRNSMTFGERQAWLELHADKCLASRMKAKTEVFAYYGNKCACCGETEPSFLTIDHVDNNGAKMRKKGVYRCGYSIYSWLRRNNYPEGFQLLCMNCNFAKGHFGFCPHQEPSRDYPAREYDQVIGSAANPTLKEEGCDIVQSPGNREQLV